MNIIKILKKLIIDTSVFFTIITPLYAAIQMIMNIGNAETAIRASWLLYIFLFSLLAALSVCLYGIKSWNKALRVAIQYVIILFASYVCFFIPLRMSGSQVLIGLTFTTVIYFACYGIKEFFLWRFNKNTKKEEVYVSKFKKLK